MLKLGVIKVGKSDYTSAHDFSRGTWKRSWLSIDYRWLNEIIRTKCFPLLNIEERDQNVSSARYITVLDLAKEYWQIPFSKRAQHYAVFCTTCETFWPLRISFGLKTYPISLKKTYIRITKIILNFCSEDFRDFVWRFRWCCHTFGYLGITHKTYRISLGSNRKSEFNPLNVNSFKMMSNIWDML